MKKVFLSTLCVVTLIAFSFTNSNENNSKEIEKTQKMDFNTNFNHNSLMAVNGINKQLIVGSSVTQFPGTLNDTFTTTKTLQGGGTSSKMQAVLDKY